MHGWVLRQFWLRRWVGVKSNTKRLTAQSGSWCTGRLCDVHRNTCVISANVKVCRSTETKGDKDEARTFTGIFRFSKGTHVDLRSQHDPPGGSEPRHLSGKIFVRRPTEMPGTSSSGMRTETRLVVEPTPFRAPQNLENPMLATHVSSEPTPVLGTDDTQDRESPDMETDDPDTTATVPEPPPVVQLVPPSPLPQHRIYGNVKLQLCTKEASDVASSCLKRMSCSCQSAAEFSRASSGTCQRPRSLRIGARIVFANSVGENLKASPKITVILHRVSDDQGVELTFDVSWNRSEKFKQNRILT